MIWSTHHRLQIKSPGNLVFEVVQPKMFPSILFYGIYQKPLIYFSNITNFKQIALIYLSIWSLWESVRLRLGIIAITSIFETQHLNIIIIILSFDIIVFFWAIWLLHHIFYYFIRRKLYGWALDVVCFDHYQ